VEWEMTRERLLEGLDEGYPGASAVEPGETEAGKSLHGYAEGEILPVRRIEALPFAWERVKGFRRAVLRETIRVPYGKTVTYGELAARAGSSGAARAAGASLAENPWPILVPCHRIVGRGGRLVGFGKGIEAKEILLRFERGDSPQRNRCLIKRQNV